MTDVGSLTYWNFDKSESWLLKWTFIFSNSNVKQSPNNKLEVEQCILRTGKSLENLMTEVTNTALQLSMKKYYKNSFMKLLMRILVIYMIYFNLTKRLHGEWIEFTSK